MFAGFKKYLYFICVYVCVYVHARICIYEGAFTCVGIYKGQKMILGCVLQLPSHYVFLRQGFVALPTLAASEPQNLWVFLDCDTDTRHDSRYLNEWR